MGKTTGFMEFERVLPISRHPSERVRDWHEFHGHMPDKALQDQGARCMDCGVPFCHTGAMLPGGASGCPVHNLIPEWNDLVFRGQWNEALSRLHKTNNFPEFTGRVCPAPCEGSCVLGINEPAVTIKNIECAIIDKGFEEGWVVPQMPTRRTDKAVAIVGSGPAGLACAAQLNQAGHRVTVFERDDRIGGLLMYGIPSMKLEKSIVERRVKLLAQEGVNFVPNTWVGKDFPTDRLRGEFDAVVLCGGATQARDLPIEGRDLGGIHLAMEYLSKNTKSLLDSQLADGRYISAAGKRVVVIGGGDTGTDCLGTAMRHGCKSLVQFEILSRPASVRPTDNPWPQWPRILRTDYGQEEANARFGSDPRQFAVVTKRFVGGDAGEVKELHTVDVEWQMNGRATMKELPGTERVWPVDLVFLAMGFVGPEKPGLLSELGVALDERGNVITDAHKRTSVACVFAAGDMSRGQSLIVWAIAEGRDAARGVDQFLMGETLLASA
jgi:glutamate synthase (NADPH/NADH) small chain